MKRAAADQRPENAEYVCSPAIAANMNDKPNHTMPLEMSAVRASFDDRGMVPPCHPAQPGSIKNAASVHDSRRPLRDLDSDASVEDMREDTSPRAGIARSSRLAVSTPALSA